MQENAPNHAGKTRTVSHPAGCVPEAGGAWRGAAPPYIAARMSTEKTSVESFLMPLSGGGLSP
ncbi:hypothetical protein GCM10009549_20840 [Streptomyces thermoalcalitolerans]|uniref:Uncharacterized protein n=1 Tax=Streptomyces thermoalcalitolerans TaxID=65605 RepID=A0ABP3Z0Q9_9ACTN